MLRAIGKGDPAALRRLYELHADALYSLALRMLQDPEEAQDALQDAFLRIWKPASKWDESLSTGFTWIVLLQRRTCKIGRAHV